MAILSSIVLPSDRIQRGQVFLMAPTLPTVGQQKPFADLDRPFQLENSLPIRPLLRVLGRLFIKGLRSRPHQGNKSLLSGVPPDGASRSSLLLQFAAVSQSSLTLSWRHFERASAILSRTPSKQFPAPTFELAFRPGSDAPTSAMVTLSVALESSVPTVVSEGLGAAIMAGSAPHGSCASRSAGFSTTTSAFSSHTGNPKTASVATDEWQVARRLPHPLLISGPRNRFGGFGHPR